MARWPSKDPGEILDYQLDWSRRLDAGDRIVTAAFSLTVPAGLAIASQSFTDSAAKVWLTSGTAGEEAEILCRIDTEGGRTFEQSVHLAIAER
jgi:hypothetical protein